MFDFLGIWGRHCHLKVKKKKNKCLWVIYYTAGLWLWLLTTCSLTATHPFCAGWVSEQKETLSWILTAKIKLFWTKWVDINHPAILKHTQVTWLLQMLLEVHWISDQHKEYNEVFNDHRWSGPWICLVLETWSVLCSYILKNKSLELSKGYSSS